jgi:hypothetical protein
LDAPGVSRLVEDALASVSPEVADRIRAGLVPPQAVSRRWHYGGAEAYVCWTVFEHPDRTVGIAYCEGGFNLTHRCPWGLVGLSPPLDIGDDSGWFSTLEMAFREV